MRRAIIGLLSAALAVLCVPPSARAQQQRSLWRGLVVAPEQRCSAYNADDYRYPQSVEDQIVTELGGVYGPYTGRWFASQFETDIEHMVARSEAHDSGLCTADEATRRRFATDLLNLTLAAPGVNRSQKGARDATDWLPDQNTCWFAGRVIAVRQKYRLTIDRREADTLERVLAGCTSTSLVVVGRGTVPPASAGDSLTPSARTALRSPNGMTTATARSPAPRPAHTGSRRCPAVIPPISTCAMLTGTASCAKRTAVRTGAAPRAKCRYPRR